MSAEVTAVLAQLASSAGRHKPQREVERGDPAVYDRHELAGTS